MDRITELKVLREDLINELDAISQYQTHIDLVMDPAAKELLAHIRDEEKEHVAELMAIIRRLDPAQEAAFTAEHTLALQQGAQLNSSDAEAEREAQPSAGGLTVGNLIGE